MAEHTTQDLGAALTLLLRAVMRVRDRFRAEAVRNGLDWSAYVVLRPLVETGPRRLTTLAESMKLSPSTVSRLVTHMIADGLLERRPDADDGRACIIAPTERGQRIYAELRGVRDDYVARLLSDWSEQDRSELVRLVARLASALEADTSDRGPTRSATHGRRAPVVPGATPTGALPAGAFPASALPPGTPPAPDPASPDLAWMDLG